MIFIVAGGGTGGHIIPALAVAGVLKQKGHLVYYLGNKGSMEERIVQSEGLPFLPIQSQKIYRKITLAHFKFPFFLVKSIGQSLHHLKQSEAKAVFCSGGYVSGPIAIAALIRKIDLYMWDGNSYPGLTTRLLATKIKVIFTAYQAASSYLKGANCQNLWIPLLKNSNPGLPPNAQGYGLSGDRPIILVTGGSQGSMAINEAFSYIVDQLLSEGFEILWQAGKTGLERYNNLHGSKPGLFIFDFRSDLQSMMQLCSLAITRAGALTIAELQEHRIPAVLVPLPTAAENHQYYNAKEQQAKGYAILLEQKKLCPEKLLETIKLAFQQRDIFAERFSKLNPNTSAEDIANHILSYYPGEK